MTDTTRWSHSFDFTVNDGGFTVDTDIGGAGSYVPGTGWIAVPAIYREAISLDSPLFSVATITSVTLTFTNVISAYDPFSNGFISLKLNGVQTTSSPNVSLTTGETSRSLPPMGSGS